MIVKAYAKMNLILKVKGILENGYHDLEMLNTRIDLFDKIKIKKSKFDNFIMTPNLCDNNKNLAYIAYNKLKEKFDIKNSYSINIKKNIPTGAGLGGGSADAAAIINAIIKLEDIKIDAKELIDFALTIGADVPYCLYGSKCIVKGIGEIINPTNINKEWSVILISPDVSFSTKNIFENWKQNDCSANLVSNIEKYNDIEKNMCNDLENAVKNAYPDFELEKIKSDLISNGAKVSLMTGSGSTVFGLFDINDKKELNKCFLYMKEKYNKYKIKKCKTISY